MKEIVLKIEDMDCAHEVAILKKELGPLVGEEALFFDVLNRKLTIKQEKIDLKDIQNIIDKTGMKATIWNQKEKKQSFSERYLKSSLVVISAISIAVGFFLSKFGLSSVSATAYALAILAGGRFVFPKALSSLRRFSPDMNLLMTISVLGAVLLGDWLEAATVSFLFSLSLLLESWSVERARNAIETLLELTPDSIRVINSEGQEVMVSAKEALVDTVYTIKPGEKISLDGLVLKGNSEVNQASITGESLPIDKKEGDAVFAGSINGNGILSIKSTTTFDQSTLSKMIQLVRDSQLKRAPSEQWVEKFARIYTPAIMGLAVLVQIIPPLFFSGHWAVWFYRALVILVIACPCALVISTPVSIVAALTSAASYGVLIKGGKFIELPSSLKAIAFDKTGTLTKGELSVSKVISIDSSGTHFLEIATALASKNTHPISKAILLYTNLKSDSIFSVDDYKTLPGKGATGKIKGQEYWLGSHSYLEEKGLETPGIHEQLEALDKEGNTLVAIGDDSNVLGFIALSDSPRDEAKETIEKLLALNIKVFMLTGDNSGSANRIAQHVGIQHLYANLLPEEKVKTIEELSQTIGTIAMIGDGINDAPAMSRSTLGIAMGVAGSDAAIESADIALMSDDLTKIPWLISHSKRTMRIIWQNITFSLLIKVLFVILTFSGHASLWGAIMADTGVSILVIFNGLRLLRIRNQHGQ